MTANPECPRAGRWKYRAWLGAGSALICLCATLARDGYWWLAAIAKVRGSENV